MIEGLKLNVTSAEIKEHLGRRIDHYHKVVVAREEERAAVAQLPHQRGDFIRSVPDPKALRDHIDALVFIKKHIIEHETYVLGYRDLVVLEFTLGGSYPAYPYPELEVGVP